MKKWYNLTIPEIWRKLFPIRKIYIPQYEIPDFKASKNKDALLPGLLVSQEKCPEMFLWLYKRLTELEMHYHLPPTDVTKAGMETYAFTHYGIGKQIETIKEVLKLPAYAAEILNNQKKAKEEIESDNYTNWGD